MWFTRKHHEYGCPMCGRRPKIKKGKTQKIDDIRNVTKKLTLYRFQCPRRHISTDWFSHPASASSQWKRLVDEYKRKDAK